MKFKFTPQLRLLAGSWGALHPYRLLFGNPMHGGWPDMDTLLRGAAEFNRWLAGEYGVEPMAWSGHLNSEIAVPKGHFAYEHNAPHAIELDRWIEGALLQNATSHLLGLNLPVALPERVEYRELGVRAEVRDEVLHVRGTHGPRERTILTVLLQGVELPLVFAPQRPIELSPYLDPWRDRAAAELARQRWLRRTGAPATAPAMAPAADGG